MNKFYPVPLYLRQLNHDAFVAFAVEFADVFVEFLVSLSAAELVVVFEALGVVSSAAGVVSVSVEVVVLAAGVVAAGVVAAGVVGVVIEVSVELLICEEI
mgnify:CR=1 FL=1